MVIYLVNLLGYTSDCYMNFVVEASSFSYFSLQYSRKTSLLNFGASREIVLNFSIWNINDFAYCTCFGSSVLFLLDDYIGFVFEMDDYIVLFIVFNM